MIFNLTYFSNKRIISTKINKVNTNRETNMWNHDEYNEAALDHSLNASISESEVAMNLAYNASVAEKTVPMPYNNAMLDMVNFSTENI